MRNVSYSMLVLGVLKLHLSEAREQPNFESSMAVRKYSIEDYGLIFIPLLELFLWDGRLKVVSTTSIV